MQTRMWVQVLCGAGFFNFALYCISAVLMMESMWGVLSSLQNALATTKATVASGSVAELQLAGQGSQLHMHRAAILFKFGGFTILGEPYWGPYNKGILPCGGSLFWGPLFS